MTQQLVRRTAKDMCGAFYEENRSEQFRKNWPNQRDYIGYNWPSFVEIARGVLASMLADKSTSQHQRDEIYAAIVEDRRRSLQNERQAERRFWPQRMKEVE